MLSLRGRSAPALHSNNMNGRANASPLRLLVISGKDTPELVELKKLPSSVEVVAIGRSEADFSHLPAETWKDIEVLLNCGVGANAGKRADIEVRGTVLNDVTTG